MGSIPYPHTSLPEHSAMMLNYPFMAVLLNGGMTLNMGTQSSRSNSSRELATPFMAMHSSVGYTLSLLLVMEVKKIPPVNFLLILG
jgi:FtsH-binding integral membrane protein